MYFVQCPKCQQRMKVKQELHQVKVRCAHCKEVFVAETQEVSDSPAPAGTKPAAAASRPAAPATTKPKASKPAFEPPAEQAVGIDLDSFAPPATPGAPVAPKVAPRVLRKKSKAPMFIVIGAGVLCILFAVIVIVQVGKNKDKKEYAVKQPDGTEKLMTKAEYDEWVKQQDEAKATANVPAPSGQVGNVERNFFGSNTATQASSNPFDDMPPGQGPNDINGDNAKAMEQLADLPEKYKDKLLLSRCAIYPNEQDAKTGTVALEIKNPSDTKTIQNLVMLFQAVNKITDKERVVGRTAEIKLEYLPPKATMRYSVSYDLSAVGKYLKPVVTQLEYAPDDTVSWMVTEALRFETANEVVKVTGTAKNETGQVVRDIMVYANFFNKTGELLGSSEPVKLNDKTMLVKEASGVFILRFDKHNKTIEDTTSADIRVVGKKG